MSASLKRDLGADDRNGLFSLYPSWRPLGGESRGTPTVLSSEPGRTDVFVRGLNNSRVYYKWRVGMEWFPAGDSHEDLGGTITSNISAVSWGPKRIDVFHRGTDKAVWHKSCDVGAGWSGWASLGGEIDGDISAVSWAPNRLDLFVKGVDAFVYYKTWDGNAWKPSQTGWTKLGGQQVGWGSPKAVCWGANRIDVFVRGPLSMGSSGGSHSDVYQKTWDGASWQPTGDTWTKLGGNPTGEISVVSTAPHRLDLFARGSDNYLLSKSWDGSKWTPEGYVWQKLTQGGTIKSSPSAVAWPSVADLITVVALLSDGEVGMNDYSGDTPQYPWSGWKHISPSLYPGKKVNSSLVDNPVLVRTGSSRGGKDWSIATLKDDAGLYVYM
ncbi:sialidase [Leptodontidium sp. MPI-SDFR-AT-0119]|nr:sialidase [Leptodontidium sp. MPI-SDFR-AT-0119]